MLGPGSPFFDTKMHMAWRTGAINPAMKNTPGPFGFERTLLELPVRI